MFSHLILIEPLGLLYGSSGRFLSPDNLIGRSGSNFPPNAVTLSGLFMATHDDKKEMADLHLAGPFWAETHELSDPDHQNFYVPKPKNYLVKNGHIAVQLTWVPETQTWQNLNAQSVDDKFPSGKFDVGPHWLAIQDWHQPQTVKASPWKSLIHLHPKLKPDERRVIPVDTDALDKPGSLFAEHAIQMEPGTCLVYLATHPLADGWYRFGGEGHMVDVRSVEIGKPLAHLLNGELGTQFALITPAVWGSQHFSYRSPKLDPQGNLLWSADNPVLTLLTERPHPFRYRLGSVDNATASTPKRLSRGRYAVPSGSIYLLKQSIKAWQEWPEDLFPREGVSYKRWGCGLALPLPQTA
jgi:CRISPR-associated protein Cmr3